jgi:hypothetical protein
VLVGTTVGTGVAGTGVAGGGVGVLTGSVARGAAVLVGVAVPGLQAVRAALKASVARSIQRLGVIRSPFLTFRL